MGSTVAAKLKRQTNKLKARQRKRNKKVKRNRKPKKK